VGSALAGSQIKERASLATKQLVVLHKEVVHEALHYSSNRLEARQQRVLHLDRHTRHTWRKPDTLVIDLACVRVLGNQGRSHKGPLHTPLAPEKHRAPARNPKGPLDGSAPLFALLEQLCKRVDHPGARATSGLHNGCASLVVLKGALARVFALARVTGRNRVQKRARRPRHIGRPWHLERGHPLALQRKIQRHAHAPADAHVLLQLTPAPLGKRKPQHARLAQPA
jgi:hypothetical protein